MMITFRPTPPRPRFSSDSKQVQSEAKARFDAHVENPKEGKALPSEYAVPVYKIVLKSGGQAEFDQVRLLELVMGPWAEEDGCVYPCWINGNTPCGKLERTDDERKPNFSGKRICHGFCFSVCFVYFSCLCDFFYSSLYSASCFFRFV